MAYSHFSLLFIYLFIYLYGSIYPFIYLSIHLLYFKVTQNEDCIVCSGYSSIRHGGQTSPTIGDVGPGHGGRVEDLGAGQEAAEYLPASCDEEGQLHGEITELGRCFQPLWIRYLPLNHE